VTTLTTTPRTASPPDGVSATGSHATRLLGLLAAALVALAALLGLVLSPAEAKMGDSVRLLYVHVPSALTAYVAVGVVALGSVMVLWKRSVFWDLMAGAAGEIGLLFTALTLVTGSLWGRPTWGTYWEWDPRLTSTALLAVLQLGYLAVRSSGGDATSRGRRAAVVGILAAADIPIVHYSVDWWRSLHQPATIAKLDPDLDGLMLFSLFVAIIAFMVLFTWLLVHRFRLAWLESQVEEQGLAIAIAERRAEVAAGYDGAPSSEGAPGRHDGGRAPGPEREAAHHD
jgi:heme exporter protein C